MSAAVTDQCTCSSAHSQPANLGVVLSLCLSVINPWDIWQKRVRKQNFSCEQTLEQKVQFSSVQLLSRILLFVTPWIAARQASLSITNSWSSLRLTSIESVMPSSHLILCCPLLLLPPIPPKKGVVKKHFNTLASSVPDLCWVRWDSWWRHSWCLHTSPCNTVGF